MGSKYLIFRFHSDRAKYCHIAKAKTIVVSFQ